MNEPTLLEAEAAALFGGLPVDVKAASRLATYDLRIVGSHEGRLQVDCLSGERPRVGAELTIQVVSGQRGTHTIESVVVANRRGRLTLEVRAVSPTVGRRRVPRAAINELFLMYGTIEVDGDVTNISVDGMRFICPLEMEIGSEVHGMLNVRGHVFPIAAVVCHMAERFGQFEIGVQFRTLRPSEIETLATLTDSPDMGRRDSQDGPNFPAPRDDIRERLRRWAA